MDDYTPTADEVAETIEEWVLKPLSRANRITSFKFASMVVYPDKDPGRGGQWGIARIMSTRQNWNWTDPWRIVKMPPEPAFSENWHWTYRGEELNAEYARQQLLRHGFRLDEEGAVEKSALTLPHESLGFDDELWNKQFHEVRIGFDDTSNLLLGIEMLNVLIKALTTEVVDLTWFEYDQQRHEVRMTFSTIDLPGISPVLEVLIEALKAVPTTFVYEYTRTEQGDESDSDFTDEPLHVTEQASGRWDVGDD
jgi:hypothetical protein